MVHARPNHLMYRDLDRQIFGQGTYVFFVTLYLSWNIDHQNALFFVAFFRLGGRGSSVGRARDSWSGGSGFDPRCGHPLPTGWVGVSIM